MSSARPTFEEALTQLNVELIKMGATVEKSIMEAVPKPFFKIAPIFCPRQQCWQI